jgi:hypothetical protein
MPAPCLDEPDFESDLTNTARQLSQRFFDDVAKGTAIAKVLSFMKSTTKCRMQTKRRGLVPSACYVSVACRYWYQHLTDDLHAGCLTFRNFFTLHTSRSAAERLLPMKPLSHQRVSRPLNLRTL